MPSETDTDPLLTEVETFLEESGMAPSTFGIGATGDPSLVQELRRGRDCGWSIRRRVRKFIESTKGVAGA